MVFLHVTPLTIWQLAFSYLGLQNSRVASVLEEENYHKMKTYFYFFLSPSRSALQGIRQEQ